MTQGLILKKDASESRDDPTEPILHAHLSLWAYSISYRHTQCALEHSEKRALGNRRDRIRPWPLCITVPLCTVPLQEPKEQENGGWGRQPQHEHTCGWPHPLTLPLPRTHRAPRTCPSSVLPAAWLAQTALIDGLSLRQRSGPPSLRPPQSTHTRQHPQTR